MIPAPTQEQEAIAAHEPAIGEGLIVEAGAGTGKTTCLMGFAQRRSKSKILYICFNNKAAAEGRARFQEAGLRHVRCSTIHGLASSKKREMENLGKFQTRVGVPDARKILGRPAHTCWWALAAIRRFCESGDKDIRTSHVPHLNAEADRRGIMPAGAELVASEARRLWTAMASKENKAPVSFDHYLKMFAMEEQILGYDYILVDEAQDCNPVSLSILQVQAPHTRIVLIGDESQAIYGWRGAHNAMRSWPAKEKLTLSESFRFGPAIASTANMLLAGLLGRDGRLSGKGPKDEVVPPGGHPAAWTAGSPRAFLARTNSSLMERAVELLVTGEPYHFAGTEARNHWDPTVPYRFQEALDAYHLWCGDRGKMRTPHLMALEHYAELKQAGEEPEKGGFGDAEAASLCRMVETHKHRLPALLGEVRAGAGGPSPKFPGGAYPLTLSSAHRAKGLEWESVELANDFVDPIKVTTIPEPGSPEEEECNLLYVAVTRAKRRLETCPKLEAWLEDPIPALARDKEPEEATEPGQRRVEGREIY